MIKVMDRDWIERYLDWLKAQEIREPTWALYEHRLRAFLEWLADRGVDLKDLGPKNVCDYLRDLRSCGYRHVSLSGVLKALQRFSRFAVEDGLVAQDPTRGICTGCLELRDMEVTQAQSVLRELNSRPMITLKYRLPIFGPAWEKYLQQLFELGYSRGHIFQTLNYNLHFHRFLAKRGVRRLTQVTRQLVDAFLGSRRIVSQRRDHPFLRTPGETAYYVEPFLRQALPEKFPARPPGPESRAVPKALLVRYLHFCSSHRGYRRETQRARRHWISRLGLFLDGQGLREISNLGIRHVDAFMREEGQRGLKPSSLHNVASSLRCFLRFLFLRGTIKADLGRQVARPMHFSANLLPKYIPWKKIEELLAAIDKSTIVGKRDYAMILLMANHGLRSHEVAGLTPADIDFEGGSMLISVRKVGPSQRLPLSLRAAQALRDYLNVRPASAHQEVFLRVRAPRRPLGRSVKTIVRVRMLRHLGASIPRHGSHLLRHSFAKVLLDRGAKLHDIGALLGHQRLDSTLTYTRVATEELREVADNYAQFIAGDHASPPPGPVGPSAMHDTARRQSRSTGRHREILLPLGKELERKA